jgi:hypothetical protein
MLRQPGRTLSPNDYLLVYDLLNNFDHRLNAQTLRPSLAKHLSISSARRISIAQAYFDAVVSLQNRQIALFIRR